MMHIHFAFLIDALSRKASVQTYNLQEADFISEIALFPDRYEPDKLKQSTVYVCDYRELRLLEPTLPLPPLVCVIEPGVSVDEVCFRRRTMAAVSGKTIPEVLLLLSNLMYDYGRQSTPLTELSHKLLRCGGIYDLLEAGFQALRNPLLLSAADERLIAFTNPKLVTAPAYHRMILQERIPAGNSDNGIDQPWNDVIFETKEANDANLPPEICLRLTQQSRVVGYLHVIAFNCPLREEDVHIVELVGNLLAIRLLDSPRSMENEPDKANFLRRILENLTDDIGGMLEDQKQLRLSFGTSLYTIVFQYSGRDIVPKESFHTLSKTLAACLTGAFGFSYRNSAVLLLDRGEEIRNFKEYLAPVQPLMEQYHLAAGVSNCFSSVYQLRSCTYQSRKALQLGLRMHPAQSVFVYGDYAIYHMIELALHSEELEAFCSPELLRLRAHSLENHDTLLETLRIYLKCGRNKAQTAREMYVHTNTIKYRMGQIQEILGIDLDNDDNALKLLLSFKMLEYRMAFQKPASEEGA